MSYTWHPSPEYLYNSNVARLMHALGTPTADELRIEYATLLGWTAGLVVAILSQLEAASAKTERLSPAPQVTMLAP